jgi:hypothetical protein
MELDNHIQNNTGNSRKKLTETPWKTTLLHPFSTNQKNGGLCGSPRAGDEGEVRTIGRYCLLCIYTPKSVPLPISVWHNYFLNISNGINK